MKRYGNLLDTLSRVLYLSLINLSLLNMHKAINDNIRAVGMTSRWMRDDDSISIFNLPQPSFSIEEIPPFLRPTFIQLRVPHRPWLDFFPFPRMRDCMIIAGDSFDDDDLCHDLMAFRDTRNRAATLLVWGVSCDEKIGKLRKASRRNGNGYSLIRQSCWLPQIVGEAL
jgi:hypothetical protein